MGISAIVVTYNRLDMLKECLHHLLNQSFALDNIFVINNNSSDGTEKYLSNLHDSIIQPVNTHKNLGGAGGFSLGTKLAYEQSKSDYFWLMDDDTMPTDDAAESLIKSANNIHKSFGFLCSNVRWWKDNKPSYMNVPMTTNDWNDLVTKGLIKVVSASFVSLLVPRHSVKELGLPIADMFIWGDDVEYTTRLSQRYPSYLVSNSIVMHKSATNSSNNSVLNAPIKRLIYFKCMFRNRLYISRKYYKARKTLKLFALYTFSLIRIPFKAKDHKVKRFMYTLEGILNGFKFNPKVRFPK